MLVVVMMDDMRTDSFINFLSQTQPSLCFSLFLKTRTVLGMNTAWLLLPLHIDKVLLSLNGVCSNQKGLVEILKFQDHFSDKRSEKECNLAKDG